MVAAHKLGLTDRIERVSTTVSPTTVNDALALENPLMKVLRSWRRSRPAAFGGTNPTSTAAPRRAVSFGAAPFPPQACA
jgi:hypothetical protein